MYCDRLEKSKRALFGSNHIGIPPETIIQCWDKKKLCTVDIRAPEIIKQYNKFMEVSTHYTCL